MYMEGLALQRWNATRGAQNQAFEQMMAQNRAYTQHKLVYHQNPPPPMQQAPPPMEPQRRQPPKLQQLNQKEAYKRTCNQAQKSHNTRIATKNKALRENGAQPQQYVRDRTPKKKGKVTFN